MIPDPLHPALVHFPIALALLAPVVAVVIAGTIQMGWAPARLWLVVVIWQVAIAGSGWVAIETGEDEEDRVEKVVAEHAIEEHEEAAETFTRAAAIVIPLVAAGLLTGSLGMLGRVASILAITGVAVLVTSVGRLGGELVYEHGAASAYVNERAADGDASPPPTSP